MSYNFDEASRLERASGQRGDAAFFMKRFIFAVVVSFIFCGIVAVARAEQYQDPTGFSFTCPGGWMMIPNPAKAKLPPDIKARFDKVAADLSLCNVLLLHRNKSNNYESIVVCSIPEHLSINDFSKWQVKSLIADRCAQRGIGVENLRAEVQQVGDNKAIVAEFDATYPGLKGTLHQCHALFSSGGKTYLVACGASAEAFGQFTPVFGPVLVSFKMPAGTGH